MKLKHLLVAGASLGLLTLTACQKEEKTTAEKLQGKWQLESVFEHIYYDVDDEERDTAYGTAADYLDFRADGKMYSFVGGDHDTTNYALQNDSKILIWDVSADIHTLTKNTFKIYFKEIDPAYPDEYYEQTINMKR
jgi:hypothetical protein